MKGPVLKWLLKVGWPIIKYVLVNYGHQIANYVAREIKEKVRAKKVAKMENAIKKEQEYEHFADQATTSEEKLRFSEIAAMHKEEAAFQRKAMEEFEKDVDEVITQICDDVVDKSNQIEFDDLFVIEGKELKAAEEQALLEQSATRAREKEKK